VVSSSDTLVDNGAVVIEVSDTSVAVLAVRCERGSIDFTGFLFFLVPL